MKRSRVGSGLIALTVAAALALAGCTGDAPNDGGDSAPGAGIVIVNSTEPAKGLIPADTTETGGMKVVDALWEGLVSYDKDGVTRLGAAESIDSDDQVNWTITLREDAVFSDGTPVQAHNFVDAWNFAANIENAQAGADSFSVIAGYSDEEPVAELSGLEIVDDLTFTVRATPDFPDRLGQPAFYPLPDAAFADLTAFGRHPIGNGPYRLDGDDAWTHDEEIRVVKNERYQGSRAAKNDGIVFKMYDTLDAAYADLLANRLDVLDRIPEASFPVFESDLGDRAIFQAGPLITALTIPENLEHFAGEEGRLRRAALSKALNREAVIDAFFNSTNIPARDFTSPVVDGFAENLKGSDVLKFDADEAKRLWAEADDIRPFDGVLELAVDADGTQAVWLGAIADQWSKNLGITAVLKPHPPEAGSPSDRTSDTGGSLFLTDRQGDYPGAYDYLQPLYGTGAGSNLGSYSNHVFDALLAEASHATDRSVRNSKLNEAQEILLADLPSIPLWYRGATGGSSTNVSNVVLGWNSRPLLTEVVKADRGIRASNPV